MPLCSSTRSVRHAISNFGISSLALLCLSNDTYQPLVYANDSTSAKADVAANDFQLLSKGVDLDNWKHNGNWKIENGVISRQGKGGSLVYTARKMPDDFDLRFEWKVSEGSNSGIYYRPTQYEYQILDNSSHADGKNPRTSAASLYFCVQPSKDMTKPVGQWNTGRVVCKGTIVQHWLNGEKVIHLDYKDPRWASNVEMLKQRGGNLEARGANLSLQDHGDAVWYRNIRLKELHATDSVDMQAVKPAELAPEVLEAEKKKLAGIVKRREDAKKRQQQQKQ